MALFEYQATELDSAHRKRVRYMVGLILPKTIDMDAGVESYVYVGGLRAAIGLRFDDDSFYGVPSTHWWEVWQDHNSALRAAGFRCWSPWQLGWVVRREVLDGSD